MPDNHEPWPVPELDVRPRFQQAPNYSRRPVTSMTIRFAGGGSGILAPMDYEQRVCLVVDGVVSAHSHVGKKSDKTTVFELAMSVRPNGVYVVEMDRGGLPLITACQSAHAEEFSTHGGELVGLDV